MEIDDPSTDLGRDCPVCAGKVGPHGVSAVVRGLEALEESVSGRAFEPTEVGVQRKPAWRSRDVVDDRGHRGRFAGRTEVAGELQRLLQLNREMTKSVEDLLLLGRIEAGVVAARREVVRLDDVVASFEATTMELAVETIGPVEIVGDPTLVHHAVSNLLVNSQVHARNPERALLIQVTVSIEGDDAVVVMTDNGPGLGDDPESLFGRHAGSRASGGLGLWIVRTIIEDQGGTVTARNGDDGAVFEIRLPRR